MASTTSQQQVASLFQSLLARGIPSQEALTTVPLLVQAKIFSLEELTADNLPATIPKKLHSKLLKGKRNNSRKRSSTVKSSLHQGKKQKAATAAKNEEIVIPPIDDNESLTIATTRQTQTILINRAAVLTLWAAAVAKTLFSITIAEALTLASAVATNCARTKGTRLGIYNNESTAVVSNDTKRTAGQSNAKGQDTIRTFVLLNQNIQAVATPSGWRALGNNDGQAPLDPQSIYRSQCRKWGTNLAVVWHYMVGAANNAGDDLAATAYDYYLHIRPDIASGTAGWGAHGYLFLAKLGSFYNVKPKETNREET